LRIIVQSQSSNDVAKVKLMLQMMVQWNYAVDSHVVPISS